LFIGWIATCILLKPISFLSLLVNIILVFLSLITGYVIGRGEPMPADNFPKGIKYLVIWRDDHLYLLKNMGNDRHLFVKDNLLQIKKAKINSLIKVIEKGIIEIS